MASGHPPDKGWAWIVMLSSFGANIIHGFFLFSVGIVHVALLEEFEENIVKTAWASSIFLGMYSLCGFVSAIFVNKWSCRVATMTGGLLMTSGFVITAFPDNLDYVFLSFGLLSGFGAGVSYSAGVVVVGFNFDSRRNFATGFALSGIGVGMFALTPLLQLAKDTYGYSGLCLMCGAVTFHLMVFGALFRPSSLEIKCKKAKKAIRHVHNSVHRRCLSGFVHMVLVLRVVGFTFLCVSLMMFCMGKFALFVHFPGLAIENGSSEADAAILLSVSGICNAVCRALAGMSSNSENISELVLYSGCFSVLGIASVLFPLYSSSYIGQLIFAMILGSYSGCCYVLLNSLSVQLVGLRDLADAFGLTMVFAGIGSFIGPTFAGILVDSGMTYSQAFMVSGFTVLLGGILGFSVSCCDQRKATNTEGHEDEEQTVEMCDI